MRVMLVGTSNSVFKNGYRGEFEGNSAITAFKYHGMGASPSILLPYALAREDLRAYDFLVIETSINDVTQLGADGITAAQVRENLRWSCAKAIAAGCKPILLTMPSLNGVRKRNNADVIHRAVAAEFQAGYVDGYDFVRAASLLKNCRPADLFKDESHLKPEVGRVVGKLVIAKMKSLAAARHLTLPLDFDFSTIMAAELSDNVVQRTNSLMSITVARMDAGDTLKIDIGTGNSLVGLAMNRIESWGYVNIAGKEAVSLLVKSRFSRMAGSFLAGVKPSPGISADDTGQITLTMSEEPFSKQHATPYKGPADLPSDGARMELMGLVLRLGRPAQFDQADNPPMPPSTGLAGRDAALR